MVFSFVVACVRLDYQANRRAAPTLARAKPKDPPRLSLALSPVQVEVIGKRVQVGSRNVQRSVCVDLLALRQTMSVTGAAEVSPTEILVPFRRSNQPPDRCVRIGARPGSKVVRPRGPIRFACGLQLEGRGVERLSRFSEAIADWRLHEYLRPWKGLGLAMQRTGIVLSR
jgi:hypothetical protein